MAVEHIIRWNKDKNGKLTDLFIMVPYLLISAHEQGHPVSSESGNDDFMIDDWKIDFGRWGTTGCLFSLTMFLFYEIPKSQRFLKGQHLIGWLSHQTTSHGTMADGISLGNPYPMRFPTPQDGWVSHTSFFLVRQNWNKDSSAVVTVPTDNYCYYEMNFSIYLST